jgi:hypothetical protein
MFSLERISSLKAPVTGLSNPLGLKSVLKMITWVRNPLRLAVRGPGGSIHPGGMRPEDSGSVYQRKEFID